MLDSAYGGPLLTACRGRQVRRTERRIKTHLPAVGEVIIQLA
jgi:hypothetical protein